MTGIARKVILTTIFYQIFYIFFLEGNVTRQEGTFNNPNQLGYWSLLSTCYLLILHYGRRMPWIDMIAIFDVYVFYYRIIISCGVDFACFSYCGVYDWAVYDTFF